MFVFVFFIFFNSCISFQGNLPLIVQVVLPGIANKAQNLKKLIQDFFSPHSCKVQSAMERSYYSLLPTFHCPEFRHMAMPHYKGGWQMVPA